MDRAEDQKRYFLFASAVYEVVIPLFKQRLETHYRGLGCPDFKAFLNHQPALHILFHLKHRNGRCCTDAANCNNQPKPPMFYDQWNQLYTNNTSPKCTRLCHCNFTANQVGLHDIDLTLASLILINVCGLPQAEIAIIKSLRKFKNIYLSHNNNGCINKTDFDILWTDLMANIQQLDPTKQDDLIRIKNRPLDPSLCNRYRIEFNDIRTKLDEIDKKVVQTGDMLVHLPAIHQGIQDILAQLTQNVQDKADDITERAPYTLKQNIFCPQFTKIDLKSLIPGLTLGPIRDVLMTDDDRICMCMFSIRFLLICKGNGSSVYTIRLEVIPHNVTSVAASMVAVTLDHKKRVQICEINRRMVLKTIQVPDSCWGIARINNILVIGGIQKIWMIDYQTGKISKTIQTVESHFRLHTFDGKLISTDCSHFLTYYNQSGWKLFTSTKLPSEIYGATSSHDGGLYVRCLDNCVYHVSSNGQNYELVQTEGINISCFGLLYFNHKKQKIVFTDNSFLDIFHVT